MKKTLKVLPGLTLLAMAFAVLTIAPQRSYAVDNQTAVSAQADTRANGRVVIGGPLGASLTASSTNTAIMNLWYTGTATAAFISIVSQIGSSGSPCMEFFAPYNVPDSSIGTATCGQTAGTFDLGASSANTLGGLCDLINSSLGAAASANSSLGAGSNYHCKLLDAYRTQVSSQTLPLAVESSAGTNNLGAAGGYSIVSGTNTILSLGITPAIGRRVILKQCQVNVPGTKVQVFGRRSSFASGYDQQGNTVNDSSLVWQTVVSADTLSYMPSQYVVYPWLEFAANLGNASTTPQGGSPSSGAKQPLASPIGNIAYDGHVVVQAYNFGQGNEGSTTSSYIQCSWDER